MHNSPRCLFQHAHLASSLIPTCTPRLVASVSREKRFALVSREGRKKVLHYTSRLVAHSNMHASSLIPTCTPRLVAHSNMHTSPRRSFQHAHLASSLIPTCTPRLVAHSNMHTSPRCSFQHA